jgi:hypothetical protein
MGESGIEVKAYPDVVLHPNTKQDWFHTAASSTFGPNNHGPRVSALLKAGDYNGALQLCRETGYDKNDLYLFTNTSKYKPSVPLRFIAVPKATVLDLLSKTDPRLISRRDVLALATKVQPITAATLGLQ